MQQKRSIEILILVSILLVAALLRALNLTHGQSFHPDERHIVMTVAGLSWENLNPRTFAYGSFPFYLMFFIGRALSFVWEQAASYDGLFLVGRGVSVVFGVAAVWLAYLLGKLLSGRAAVGLVAAALLAFNPFHLQLSRFGTVDGVLTTLNLAALLGCVQLITSQGRRGALLTTIMVGLSLSTKISSLSLGLPVVLSLLFAFGMHRFYRQPRFYALGMIMLVGVLAVSFVTQPFAVFDYATFRAHTTEQVNMVRGVWRPPYVIQYEHTAPYLYHLKEMFHFTIGIPAALAAMLGFLIVGRDLLKRRDLRWLVVLAWALAVFVIVGRYQVKFPRYFLPLYPVIMIVAAVALVRIADWLKTRGSAGWSSLPAALVVLLSLFSSVAFVQIYREPHVYEQSSRWMYEHFPRGSTILGVHWDDKLPMTLPGFSPPEYGFRFEGPSEELPIYEADNEQKIRIMMSRLAKADFVVFPTARTYGSIMRVPEEFPYTTRMFQLLFARELGFDLVASFKVRPSLLGRTINDDLADESFSVYDHPKVLVFANSARKSATEMEAIVFSDTPSSSELPNRDAMLLAEAGVSLVPDPPGAATWYAQAGAVLSWYLLLQYLSLLLAPLLSRVFANAPDLGFAFSKVLALPLFGILLWALGMFAHFPLTSSTVWVVLVLLSVSVWQWVWQQRGSFLILAKAYRREFLIVETLFAASLVLYLSVRAANPEIFWGEKPMDFSFLNYFARLTELPPDDPWFYRPGEGRGMGYYYLGFFAYAVMIKLLDVPGGVAYNLGVASVGAFSIIAAYGVLLWITRSRGMSLVGALALILTANAEVLRLWLVRGDALDFDLYWASSRALTSPAITEYPSWTLLFADFHPHLMALPVTIALVGLAFSPVVKVIGPRMSWVAAALTGVVWGLLVGLNSWDAIVSGLLIGVGALMWLVRIMADPIARAEQLNRWIGASVAFAIFGGVTVSAFSSTSHSGIEVHWGYVWGNEFNTLDQVLRHFGLFFAPLAACALLLLLRDQGRRSWLSVAVAGCASFLSVAVPVGMSLAQGVSGHPWGVLSVAGVIIFLGALFAQARHGRVVLNVSGVLLVFSGVVMIGAELFFLMDRMNTIFKFYLPLWSLLGVAVCCVVYELIQQRSCPRWYGWGRFAALGITGVALGLGVIASGLNTKIMTSFSRVGEPPRPTLDGTAYLERLDGDEARMLRWLSQSIAGTPPIVEAWGPSYSEFTRVSMHTGLPTVVGWEHHIYQRGAPRQEIEQRKRDVREIYTTGDPQRLKALMVRYGVELIVVGNVERRMYQAVRGVVFSPQGVPGITVLKEFGPVAVLKVR